MPTVLDIVEIVLDCVQFAQDVKNVFHYIVKFDSTEDDILLAAQEFIDNVVFALRPITSDTVLFEGVRIKNLTDEDEFGVVTINAYGGQSGDAFPSYVAAGFLLSPASGATRPGSKRFAGVRESEATNGALNAGGFGAWDAMETILPQDITFGTSGVLAPIILGRNDDGTYDLDRWSIIADATLKVELTSQVSRKIGRGA